MIGFAAVLIVLSLGIPKGYDDVIKNLHGFIPFALTFGALLLIWIGHKNLFRRYPLDDTFSLVVNGVFLFTLLFYAYPLRFIAGSFVSIFTSGDHAALASPDQLRNLFVIYGLGWMVVFFCVALLYLHAARSADSLGLSEIERYDAVSDGIYYLCFVAGGAISVALADANAGVEVGMPALAYCFIGVLAAVSAYIRRRNRPDSLEAALSPGPPGIPEAPHD
jgi:transmembrane protein TMEM174 (potassium channel)